MIENREPQPDEFELKKQAYFTKLGFTVRQALKEHIKGGLWERKPDSKERSWGNVSEHCLVEVARVSVLADQLGLPAEIKSELMTAAALHDAGKRREIELVSQDGISWENFERASEKSKNQMQEAGFDPSIIQLAHSVGHGSLVETESILTKGELSPDDIAYLTMHYVDDYTVGSNWSEPATEAESGQRINNLDRRMDKNESSEQYAQLNEEGRQYLHGETAFEAQRRIGHLIEAKLAELISQYSGEAVDPITLPEQIDQVIKAKIEQQSL